MSRRLALSLVIVSSVTLIGLAAVFAFPLRGVFISAVVAPLVQSYQVLRWYIHRLPQLALWIAFVIAGAIILLRFLVRTFPPPKTEKKRRYVLVSSRRTSELKRLTTLIGRAQRHPFARRGMASDLVSLSVRLIAQRERLPLREARKRFESFEWCDDDSVRAFFNFRRQYYGVGRGKVFDKRLHEVVAFLEHYHQGV